MPRPREDNYTNRYRDAHPDSRLRWRVNQAINLLARTDAQEAVSIAKARPCALSHIPMAMNNSQEVNAATLETLKGCAIVDAQAQGDQIRLLLTDAWNTYTVVTVSVEQLPAQIRQLTPAEILAARLYTAKGVEV